MAPRRATETDAGALARVAVRAFDADPILRWLYPDDEVYRAGDGELLLRAMTGWIRLGEVWCTDDATAVAVWIPPGRPDVPSDPPSTPPPADLAARFGVLGSLMDEHTPAEEHWYLQLLATDPDHQRRGHAAALMGVVFERADAEGLPCYLETQTAVNVPYYRRHGFDVVAEWDVPTGEHRHRFSSFGGDPATEVGPHMWGMLRPTR